MLLTKLQMTNQIMAVQWKNGIIILKLISNVIDIQIINVKFNENEMFISIYQ